MPQHDQPAVANPKIIISSLDTAKLIRTLCTRSWTNYPQAIRDAQDEISNMLNLGALPDQGDETYPAPEECLQRVNDLVSGKYPDFSAKMKEIAKQVALEEHISSTAFQIEALRRIGLDVDAFLFLIVLNYSVEDTKNSHIDFVVDGEKHEISVQGTKNTKRYSSNPWYKISICLNYQDPISVSENEISIPRMPETVMNAFYGKSIKDVVSGHIFDNWNAKILDIDDMDEITVAGNPIKYVWLIMANDDEYRNISDLI